MSSVPAASVYVEHDALRLHHLDWGAADRPAIVLVHGSRLHAHVWNDFCRRFADRYHILAVDQRGHGDSAWCPQRNYDWEHFCRDLHAVVEARGLRRFTLIGHSLGGRVSMLYAARHPARVERLVLVDVTAGHVPRAPQADAARVAQAPAPREFASPQAAEAYLARLMERAPRHLVAESVRHGMRRLDNGAYTWKYDPALLGRTRGAAARTELWSTVQIIAAPTLLQWGSLSEVVTAELAARMGATMPRCRVERIDGAGHALFTDQPDAFAASVGRFLESS